mgnify:CR=1 FL=1
MEDSTLPPRRPNNPREFLKRALEWAKAHPEAAIRAGCVLVGFVAGAVLF